MIWVDTMNWRVRYLLLLLFMGLQISYVILMHNYNYATTRSDLYIDAPPLRSKGRNTGTGSSTSKQRVVLLAGPHKTGSTSIQANLIHWLSEQNHSSNLAATWTWPSPVQQFIRDGNGDCIEPYPTQVFYWWILAMYGGKQRVNCMYSTNNTQLYQREQFIQFYRREFYNHWMRGKSLVIATEALDKAKSNELVVPTKKADDATFSYDRVDAVFQELPWNTDYIPAAAGSDEDVMVVVVYRSPRIDHLQSMWHQCCMRKLNMSFHGYLTGSDSPLHLSGRLLPFDSLFLASRFLDKGLQLTLIDMEGVIERGYDISNVVACDILGANCNTDKTFIGLEHEKPELKNVRSKFEEASTFNNVTAHHKERINSAILSYDCNYAYIVNHPNVQVLYSFGLKRMLEGCKVLKEKDKIKTLKSLTEHIAAIVREPS